MKRLDIGAELLYPLFLGVLVGGLGATLALSEIASHREARREAALREAAREAAQQEAAQRDRLADDPHDVPCSWRYMKADESGWLVAPIDTPSQWNALSERASASATELVFPVFPTVYKPDNCDEIYYNAILASGMKRGDKVLVIGTGSGSDAWVASLKSQSLVYVVDVNPMAIANARITARLGNFQIRPICGDIRAVDFPDDFRDFDFVLWNMPFVTPLSDGVSIDDVYFHDGDDGSILRGFLGLLPSLLKKGGRAIILNTADALEFIDLANVTTKKDEEREHVMLYILSGEGR